MGIDNDKEPYLSKDLGGHRVIKLMKPSKATVPAYYDSRNQYRQLDDGIQDEDEENDTVVYQ